MILRSKVNGSHYRGVVFDLDGTLIDSAPTICTILNEMRLERGDGPLDLLLYRKWSSEGGSILVGNALGIDREHEDAAVAEFRRRYAMTITPPDSLYEGVRQMLKILQENKKKMAICSNKPEHLCEKVLLETDLNTFFDMVVGGDTLKVRKPHGGPLLLAISALGLSPSEILYVGDSIIDKQTSEAADVDYAHFSGGYDPQIITQQCVYQFERHEHLAEFLICASQSIHPDFLV
ncbi:phosphoglycolate phosphatase [mine drainage metagenome]|uniref:Phosphoglycolate phosphatase n=1 Tax=mine drainage metagenome TaxID=410659 RepID=A0A1J5QWF7_9ZZZZ